MVNKRKIYTANVLKFSVKKFCFKLGRQGKRRNTRGHLRINRTERASRGKQVFSDQLAGKGTGILAVK